MIPVTPHLSLDPDWLTYNAVRASGPGGQNVNKVSSAIELRFDTRLAEDWPEPLKARLLRLAGQRATREGEIVIFAQRFRDQPRNREDALDRLIGLIRRATEKPKPRIATKPSRTQQKKRVEKKVKRGAIKANRRKPRVDD